MNETLPSYHDPRLTRLIIVIFGMSIPLGLLFSYFLLPKIVEWTQSQEITVMVGFVPLLVGVTSVLALMTLRWKARRPLPLFLYPVGGFGASALYLGFFIVSAILVVQVLGPTGGLEDPRNWVVIGLAWAMTLLVLMDFVLWVTRSGQLNETGLINDQQETWEIYISEESFQEMRKDARFVALLSLARVVNGLNFCFQSLLESNEDHTPAGQRQRSNSLLIASGILYEGLKLANTLGKWFADRESFRAGFGSLLKDEETKKLQKINLDPIRNKVAFHYDEDVVTSTLQNLNLSSYIFATAYGSKTGAIFFRLADEVAINFIIGEPGSREEEERVLREILTSTTRVMTKFVRCAHELITDVLMEMNWLRRESKADS